MNCRAAVPKRLPADCTFHREVYFVLKTIRMRRNRPSSLAVALALMLTMLFVYGISLTAPKRMAASSAASSDAASAELHMEGMDVSFLCAERAGDALEARIRAASCVQQGGAGLVLPDGDLYAVILDATDDPRAEGAIRRQANGLTLRLRGSASEIAAVSGALDFLRAQARETGALASALEGGGTDAASIRALLNVYRTQGKRSQSALAACEGGGQVLEALRRAVDVNLDRLGAAIAETAPSGLRLVHAGACAEWIGLLEALPEDALQAESGI